MPLTEAKYTKYSCGDAEPTERCGSLGKKMCKPLRSLRLWGTAAVVGPTLHCVVLSCIAECWKTGIRPSSMLQLHSPAPKNY